MALHNLLPLAILLIFVSILAFILFVAHSVARDVSQKAGKRMEKMNVMFTRDGMKVGIREVNEEDYRDRTQSVLVNMWNHTSFPAYKSRFWNMGTASGSGSGSVVEEHKVAEKRSSLHSR